ncbi:MAG: 3-deoxy-manno-octulosonate cytidylyltransferase [Candidatus Latescibacterota bacterium]|nr:MAG: 3-deoxy-manno-octulosonate cytidylyltransferase [Candidatus Latescibacterota bacterium]
MNAPRFVVVLPARFDSQRFPGKPLAVIAGKPLIEWVYQRAQQIRGAERVVVATDHPEIVETVERFGGNVVMTSGDHLTGTDRVAEVATSLDCECVVNLQGDEPIFPTELVEEMVAVMGGDKAIDIVTACHPVFDREELANPNVVKVVMDRRGRALYFSRLPIPLGRDASHGAAKSVDGCLGYRHIGIYAFRRQSLLRMSQTKQSALELSEGLEQLRALEHEMVIHVLKTAQPTVGVDVPEDVKNVEKALGTT